jgi:hypothetical protein
LPDQNDWAFSATEPKELARLHAKIPKYVDILITHGPPQGILDQNNRGQNIGCNQLLKTVERVKPRLHVFGHCHEAYGLYCSFCCISYHIYLINMSNLQDTK